MSKRIILLQALTSTSGDLARTLKRVDEETARRRLAPDQWSVIDTLNHLVDVERRYLQQLKRVVHEECPLLPALYPRETAADSRASVATLLAQFEEARGELLLFLRDISAGQWQRPAVHESWGETKLRFLVQYLVDHDTQYLSQLVELLHQLRTEPAL